MPRFAPVALLLLAGGALAQSAPAEPTAPAAGSARRAVVALRESTAWFGVRVAPVDADTRSAFQIAEDVSTGVVITEVFDGSPAARAGLRPGDVVTTFSEKPVADAAALVEAVRARKPGEMVSYVVRRGTGTIAGTCRLGEHAAEEEERVIELETPVVPVPPDKAELEHRAAALRSQVAELNERMERIRRGAAAGKGWEAWIDREERALEQARAKADHAGVMVHQVRLDLLRELRDSGTAAPAAPPAAELRRIEQKLDRILGMLEQRRPGGEGARSR